MAEENETNDDAQKLTDAEISALKKYKNTPSLESVSRLEIIENNVKKEVKKEIISWAWKPVVVVMFCLTFFGLVTYNGMETAMEMISEKLLKKAEVKLNIKTKKLLKDAEHELKVEIKKLYSRDKITKVVDKIMREDAEKIITEKTEKAVRPIITSLEKEQKQISDLLAKSMKVQQLLEDKAHDLKQITEFTLTLLSAENGSWIAFDQLGKWSKNKKNPLWELSGNAYVKIRLFHEDKRINRGYLSMKWPNGVNPSILSFEKLVNIYANSGSEYHASMVNFLWSSSNVSRKQKMAFFIEILRDSNSLTAKNYAGKFFAKAAKDKNLEWKAFNMDNIFQWWKEHKDEIK